MSKTILVVDDSLVSRMMIKAIIEPHIEGVTIIEAGSGDQAIAKITPDMKIDAALIDYNMPGMNGLELIQVLADAMTIPNVALLTANIQDEIKAQALSLGVLFINKPINEDNIVNFLDS